MHALVGDQLLDGDLGVHEGALGRSRVAHLPGENVVVVPARAVRARGLAFEVLAQHRRIRRQRLERIDQRRQVLVVDLDQLDRIGRDVAVLGDHEGDLLILEQNLGVGEHRLHVASERRHVVQVQGLKVVRQQHRDHARERLGLARLDDLMRA